MSNKTIVKHPEHDWVITFATESYYLGGISINIKSGPPDKGERTSFFNWAHGVYKAIADVTGVEFEKALCFDDLYREIYIYRPNQEPEFVKEDRSSLIP